MDTLLATGNKEELANQSKIEVGGEVKSEIGTFPSYYACLRTWRSGNRCDTFWLRLKMNNLEVRIKALVRLCHCWVSFFYNLLLNFGICLVRENIFVLVIFHSKFWYWFKWNTSVLYAKLKNVILIDFIWHLWCRKYAHVDNSKGPVPG